MRSTMTAWALALAAAFTWTATVADAQQNAPQRQRAQTGGVDDRIEDYVLVRLAERAWVGGDFDVTVQDGTATLTGTVPSEATKARVGRIARRTIGVREIENNLRVNPSVADADTRVSDAELAQRVARRIASQIRGAKTGEDWWLEGWRVEGPDNLWNFVVEAENGRVYLEGDVPRLSIMRQAIDAARQASGVQSVRSDLDVDRVYGGYPYGFYGAYPHPYTYTPSPFGRDNGAPSASPPAGAQDQQGTR